MAVVVTNYFFPAQIITSKGTAYGSTSQTNNYACDRRGSPVLHLVSMFCWRDGHSCWCVAHEIRPRANSASRDHDLPRCLKRVPPLQQVCFCLEIDTHFACNCSAEFHTHTAFPLKNRTNACCIFVSAAQLESGASRRIYECCNIPSLRTNAFLLGYHRPTAVLLPD